MNCNCDKPTPRAALRELAKKADDEGNHALAALIRKALSCP